MGFRDGAARGQAEPGAGTVALPTQAHQRFQGLGAVLGFDALTVVRHEDRGSVIVGNPPADSDKQFTVGTAVVHGVGEQVLQQRAELSAVGVKPEVLDFNHAVILDSQVTGNFFGDLAQGHLGRWIAPPTRE